MTWREWEGNRTQTNLLRSLLKGVPRGLGISVQGGGGGDGGSSFEKLPSTCVQGVVLTMLYTDDADERLTHAQGF